MDRTASSRSHLACLQETTSPDLQQLAFTFTADGGAIIGFLAGSVRNRVNHPLPVNVATSIVRSTLRHPVSRSPISSDRCWPELRTRR